MVVQRISTRTSYLAVKVLASSTSHCKNSSMLEAMNLQVMFALERKKRRSEC